MVKLYRWDGVLSEWKPGTILALAESEDEARKLALAALRNEQHFTTGEASGVPDDHPVWDTPQWDYRSRPVPDIYLDQDYYEDRKVLLGPPTAVHDTSVALCFYGSA